MKLVTDSLVNDLIQAGGAAFSSTVIGYLRGVIPADLGGLTMTDEILTVIVGYILKSGWLIKNPMLKNFGHGMWLAGLSHFIGGLVPQAAGSFYGSKHSTRYDKPRNEAFSTAARSNKYAVGQ